MTRPDWQTAEQAAWEVANKVRRAREDREIVERLLIWRFCAKKSCRRLHTCSKPDANACMRGFFAALPEEVRVWFCLVVTAMNAGVDAREADRLARERIAAVEAAFPLHKPAGKPPVSW